ncbi:MAG: hypothetical protein KGH95_01165 [Thaumarchaeota archaeon]|nr:hypothetical protein [Nitrososphaerota archaeon]
MTFKIKSLHFTKQKLLFVAILASVFCVTISNAINSDAARLNSNIYFIVLPAILSITTIRLVAKIPSHRKLFILFALFAILSAVAEDVFIIYESVLKVNPFPSIADGFWLTGYVSLFMFFVAYLFPLRKTIPKKIFMLALAISVGFLIPNVIQAYSLNSNSDGLSLAISLVYPVLDAVILGPIITCIIVLYNKKFEPFLFVMLAGVLSFIVADSIYLVIYNSYENGNPIDIGWILGYILFTYAMFLYNPKSREQKILEKNSENKKIANELSTDVIVRFVIPLIAISLFMIGSIYLAEYYFKEQARDPEENLVPTYFLFGVFASLLLSILIINRNLMKIVKNRTRELEGERDILKTQNDEKNQLIAKSKALESQLEESLQKLEMVRKEKDEFVAMMTHELKNPLVPIMTYAELLLSKYIGNLNNDQVEKIQIIKSSSESLLRIVNDFLDVQKIELGQLKLDKQRNNLTQIVQDFLEKIKPVTENKGIIVTQNIRDNITCTCDRIRIEQVLDNLFLNCIDFVQPKNGRIGVELDRLDNMAKITIRDNGIGIEKDKLDKLFIKFYQVDTSTTREHGGTGLGLSICKGIISSHGGEISIRSEGLGKGAEFEILLPIDEEISK